MFIRRRKKPLTLQKLECILSRLDKSHKDYQQISIEMAQSSRGYHGERRMDYFLAFLPDEYKILSDVTLEYQKLTFQIDSLIVTKYGIYIIEVKNFRETITFNTALRQLTQHDGEITKAYPYPITQAENAHRNLMYWLEQRNLGGLPIHHFVAIAFSSKLYNVIGEEEEISKNLAYADYIPAMIIQKNEELKSLNMENKQLKNRIISAIMNDVKEFDIDFLDRFQIPYTDILIGVRCQNCDYLGMKRIHSNWHCNNCQKNSRTAHIQTIKDFELLFNKKLINKSIRDFLKINSRYTTYRLIKQYETMK